MTKLALITGSTQGIGYEIALFLAHNGYRVIINGRQDVSVKNACQSIGSAAIPLVVDIKNYAKIKPAIQRLVSEHGQLDLVISNIGSGRYPNDYPSTPIETYKDCFELNFFQCINLFNDVFDFLNKIESQLIAISSIAGCEDIGAPIAYQSAKAALLAYMKSLSRHCAKDNIRVNGISPGNVLIKDGLWDHKLKEDEQSVRKYIQQHVPLNDFVSGENIGKTVLFLESNRSITGENIVVDAGQSHCF